MFHTILLLSYTIPGIYLFIRIWQLFIARKHRGWYVLMFSALFLIYPFSNILEDEANGAAMLLKSISDYLLPLFLYLFLLILLTDLLLLINRITGIVNHSTTRKTVHSYSYFLSLISASLIIVAGGIINFNSIRTTEYRLSLPGKSSDLQSLRIAFVSDFHLDESVPVKFVERYVRKIAEINPDILLYGGDIVEGSGDNIPVFEAMLGKITAKYGIYGAPGNHDRLRDFHNNFFSRAGITLLRDSIVVADNHFIMAGRKDNRYDREDAEILLENAPDLPVILIDHRPTDFENISNTATDLVFSGHTHKGQLFPINIYLKSIYELSYGYMKKKHTQFIVSSGIRLWGPRVRTTGKSEIVIVNATFVSSER